VARAGAADTERAAEEPVSRRRTVARLWQDAVAARTAPVPYLAERDGHWEPVSWEDAEHAVEQLAHGLLALGVRKGDAFAILGNTSLEWVQFDLALASIGAIGVGVYMNNSARDAQYVVEHSEAVGALCEDEEQAAKVAPLALAHMLTFADLDDLRARGREHAQAHPDALADAARGVGEEDVFTYIYTSGTTGPPKGCVITHRNYYDMADVVRGLDDFVLQGDTMLMYLPLAHNFGRLMHLLGPHQGFTLAFLRDPLRAADALLEVRPTVLPSVPRVYEKVHAAVTAKFDEETGVKRRLIQWALRVGYAVSDRVQRGEPIPRGLALQHRIASRLVYAKVRERLGGRIRLCISGAAPLAPEVIRFFHALDVLILEGYGLTECTTAATVNRPTRFRLGTVGPALPNVELRLADDGELLIRSPTVFRGYLKDDEATREVLTADGWLRSGDIATIDDDGFVTITDRKKDILVTAGGKNVAPQNLENELKTFREISQALVVGDRRPFVAALLTLDEEATAAHTDEQRRARVQAIVDTVNRERSRFEQIKKFVILPRDFTAEEGEITPTLKLKRNVCLDHFAAEVDALYDSKNAPK
jgi:long-chain acyl-CoA synthetase